MSGINIEIIGGVGLLVSHFLHFGIDILLSSHLLLINLHSCDFPYSMLVYTEMLFSLVVK